MDGGGEGGSYWRSMEKVKEEERPLPSLIMEPYEKGRTMASVTKEFERPS